MKKLVYDFHCPSSRRPTWLLTFVGIAKGTFDGEYPEQEYRGVFHKLSNLLDETTFVRRSARTTGKIVPRDIMSSKMVVYSTAARTPLLTIVFE